MIQVSEELAMKSATDAGSGAYQDLTTSGSPDGATAMIPPSPPRATFGYAHRRKSNPVNEVTPQARAWLGRLPYHVRPINLIGQYPRIVNRIAEAWNSPAAFGEFSTDLLYDFRGNRTGFPPEIVRELRALREHYYLRSSPKR